MPAVIEPPGELTYSEMSFSGSSASRNSIWAMIKFATLSSIECREKQYCPATGGNKCRKPARPCWFAQSPWAQALLVAPFTLLGHTSSLGSKLGGGTQPALCGPAVQRIQGLLVADAMPNAIQPSILRQTSPDLFEGLLRLGRQRCQFAVELLVTDFDLFLVSNLPQDQRCLHLAQCAIALPGAQAGKVHALH